MNNALSWLKEIEMKKWRYWILNPNDLSLSINITIINHYLKSEESLLY